MIVAEEVPRAFPKGRRDVSWVVETAPPEGQAAAADASRKLVTEALDQRDLFVEPFDPRAGQAGPFEPGRCSGIREIVERLRKLGEGQPHPLRHTDQRQSTEDVSPVDPMSARRPFGADQPA